MSTEKKHDLSQVMAWGIERPPPAGSNHRLVGEHADQSTGELKRVLDNAEGSAAKFEAQAKRLRQNGGSDRDIGALDGAASALRGLLDFAATVCREPRAQSDSEEDKCCPHDNVFATNGRCRDCGEIVALPEPETDERSGSPNSQADAPGGQRPA